MQESSDLDRTSPNSTTSLHSLPCELLIQLLKELRSLAQLQATILASRHLFSAYQSSRSLVRQQVFINEFHDLSCQPETPLPTESDDCDDCDDCSMCSIFELAQSRIVHLEASNPADGLILRACIWPDLLEHAKSERNRARFFVAFIVGDITNDLTFPIYAKSLEIFTEWSLALSAAYRRGNKQKKALGIDEQTLDLLKTSLTPIETGRRKIEQLIMEWLLSIMTDCAAHRQYDAGFAFFQGIWDRFIQIQAQNYTQNQNPERYMFEMIKSLEWFCADINPESHSKGYEIEAQSWRFMHRHISQSHSDGNFCMNCLYTANSLTSTSLSLHAASDVLIAYQKSVWRGLPPRSMIFANWSRILVQTLRSEGKEIEGLMMVWQRLQESRDPGVIDSFDLDWARQVIVGLKKAGEMREACEIQDSVFLRLEKGTGQYFAWGRNLSKAYAMNGQVHEATAIAEQMCDGLSPTSKFYTIWTQEVSKLHKILDSEEKGSYL